MLDSPEQGRVVNLSFGENRKRKAIEIGPAGSLTADLPDMVRYFEQTDSNYLAVDSDPRADFTTVNQKPWAKGIKASVLDLAGVNGMFDEVLARNPSRKSVSAPNSPLPPIIKKAHELLRPGGTFVFESTYNLQMDKIRETEDVRNVMEQAGFEISPAETHPFIEALDRFDRGLRETDKIVVIARKPKLEGQD